MMLRISSKGGVVRSRTIINQAWELGESCSALCQSAAPPRHLGRPDGCGLQWRAVACAHCTHCLCALPVTAGLCLPVS